MIKSTPSNVCDADITPVRETLHYAAALRLPASIDRATRTTVVNQSLDELGLTDVADTVIGGFGGLRKGISGGERRRVSIACILVALPSVIVLDEPTSGLDAFTVSHRSNVLAQ